MVDEKNEIDKLIDNMITSGDDLVDNLKTVLPNSLSESMVMFHESNVANLKKIKEFLRKVVEDVQYSDRNNKGAVEPVCNVDMLYAPLPYGREEHDCVGDPNDCDQ